MGNKAINLISLISAKNDLSPEILKVYLENAEVSVKSSELDDIEALVERLKSTTKVKKIFNYYHVGFTIKQIGKEFDLLRLGVNYNINIELKKENTGEKIKKQLIKNEYYLNSLGKEVFNFTYVSNEDSLYFLEKNHTLSESSFEFLADILYGQDVLKDKNLSELFAPTKYLISPFNSTDRFIDDQYFLTHSQEVIKQQLYDLYSASQKRLFSIEGGAGTGKTLLTYDIAKYFIKNKKKVLIVHSGQLNEGQEKLVNSESWDIIPAKEYKRILSEQFDLIIVDEAQRIYRNQLEEIINHATDNDIACIFSFDPKQCLHEAEFKNDIPGYLENKVEKKFKLTGKIRTNPEISAFIKNLLDLSKESPEQVYENVEVQYFSHIDDARGYINSLVLDEWTTINYTVSRYKWCSLDEIIVHSDKNVHGVVGQEFDKVIAVVGESFFYDKQGKLLGDSNSYYLAREMLFQILTRTRSKLCLIIINNEPLLEKCLSILSKKTA
ncbi:DUF2075 domain-containing protein [Bacillus cereus]|uniref:DNA/RNA helicase domain-containing protein n=1 Tax=Bacillus cereus TaxID=1396 RepID=UPI00111CCDB9|nr:DNA/RNA helicase domain-containing protein [Bacillus cereus]TNO99964.1 DUF2075 domain-containing protein [Bacillus cereus]